MPNRLCFFLECIAEILPFEEDNNFINCQMLCWIIQFVKFVVQGVKNISYFPEPVIIGSLRLGGLSLFSK